MKQLPPTFKTNDFQLQRLHSSIGKSVICRTLVSFWSALLIGAMTLVCEVVHASDAEDERILAALDTKYQRAVQDNNATTMAAILADNFLLIDGDGTRSTKAAVTADCNVTHPVGVKVDHLGKDGGFGTAHADSGASSGDTSIEAPGIEYSRDSARDRPVAGDGAAAFTRSGSSVALRAA